MGDPRYLNKTNKIKYEFDDLILENDYSWPTKESADYLFNFIKDNKWFKKYDFWIHGAFPKILAGDSIQTFDIDMFVVSKNNIHDFNEIEKILKTCTIYSHNVLKIFLDINYQPEFNLKLIENNGKKEYKLHVGEDAWGDNKSKWPRKENFKDYSKITPVEKWYTHKELKSDGRKLLFCNKEEPKQIKGTNLYKTYTMIPSEKAVLRTIDGHLYRRPIHFNGFKNEN